MELTCKQLSSHLSQAATQLHCLDSALLTRHQQTSLISSQSAPGLPARTEVLAFALQDERLQLGTFLRNIFPIQTLMFVL